MNEVINGGSPQLVDMHGFEPMLSYITAHQGPPGYRLMVCYHRIGWLLECWTDGPHDTFCLINTYNGKRKWYKTLTGATKGARPNA